MEIMVAIQEQAWMNLIHLPTESMTAIRNNTKTIEQKGTESFSCLNLLHALAMFKIPYKSNQLPHSKVSLILHR